jgi:hypothetical protein
MSVEAAAGILRTISNPIRCYLIQSLKGNAMVFSDLMRACGLDPNFDTGNFSYHLSVLLDSNIVVKKENEYQLTTFGNTIANFLDSLQRESAFLLKTLEPRKGGEGMMANIEAGWLSQADMEDGSWWFYRPMKSQFWEMKKEELLPSEPADEPHEFYNWERTLPQPNVPLPNFFGYFLGFKKDGIKLGAIHVRFCKRVATGMTTAQILGLFTVDNNYRDTGISRISMFRQMMEEFLRQAKEHKTQSIEMEKVDAEDEDLTSVLKELGFERYQTTYMMQKII